MMRVPVALIATSPTSFDAGLKCSGGELGDKLGLPAEDATGRDADIAAVVTQRDIGLAQVGVGACGTALSALEARVDAGNQRAELNTECPRMRLQNLLCARHIRIVGGLVSVWATALQFTGSDPWPPGCRGGT
jgi:hypothetical protein